MHVLNMNERRVEVCEEVDSPDLSGQQWIDGIQPIMYLLVAEGLQQVAAFLAHHAVTIVGQKFIRGIVKIKLGTNDKNV